MADDATPTADGTGDASTVAAPEPTADREPPSWDEIKSLRSEAKTHRLARRQAEAERDTLRTRVDAHDRADIERQIADRIQTPADFWLTTQLSDLRDGDGQLDQDKLAERVDAVLADRPHWRAQGRTDFSSGVRQPVKQPKTIGAAFKNAIGGR